MTLYEMLDVTLYYQTVWIFEHNAYDQNMPIFKGTVDEARHDINGMVWDFLMCDVVHYECTDGILDIRVKNEYFEEKLEGHYSMSAERWGRERDKRPWVYSAEISSEKSREAKNG